jgi:hypothetical protein
MREPIGTSPAAAETGFYLAFERLDLHLMSTVWLEGDRAVCIHPGGGLLRGKESVMRSWREIFSGSKPPRIEHRLIDSFESAELVVHLVEERIGPRGDASVEFSRVIATNVYVRENGTWFLAEHHGSLPMVDQGPSGEDGPRIH